jgi:signal transduction histidine kinase
MSVAARDRLRLPAWTRSIRFRLTLLYSSVLFALAALLVGALYLGLSLSLRNEPVSSLPGYFERVGPGAEGPALVDAREFERRVNERTLRNLRNFSFGALGALFVTSLVVGWVIAGRVLAPIGRITSVARDIQATNLSRRIALEGPDDELRRLAETFDAMLARLDEAFAAQRRFLADASHELRNPLAVAQMNLDVALDAPDASPETLRRAARVARRATGRMAKLVDDLLALARLEAPEALRARRQAVDLAALVAEAGDEFAAYAQVRGVAIERAGSTDVTVVGDPDALKRALANLVDNAVRVAPAGSRVRVATGREDGWAWLAVADEGPGIDPGHQARVFDRFYRVDKARSRDEGGTGLGLAIVREIAESHGGSVRVFSEPGKGSAFVVWLPVARTPAPAPSASPV